MKILSYVKQAAWQKHNNTHITIIQYFVLSTIEIKYKSGRKIDKDENERMEKFHQVEKIERKAEK
jgi:hypothetical protein